LTRTTVTGSSNADALVNFSAGTKDVFATWIADKANKTITRGKNVALATNQAMA
jgi:hypothetical protein